MIVIKNFEIFNDNSKKISILSIGRDFFKVDVWCFEITMLDPYDDELVYFNEKDIENVFESRIKKAIIQNLDGPKDSDSDY